MKNLHKQKINMLLTAIVICISVVAVGVVYTPKILKMDMKVVETGSMSPTIKPYSLIYIRPYDSFEDYRVGDIVTFTETGISKKASLTGLLRSMSKRKALLLRVMRTRKMISVKSRPNMLRARSKCLFPIWDIL